MIKIILVKLYCRLIQQIREIKWFIEYKKCVSSLSTLTLSKIDTNKKSIILVPHADDEWVGCSSVIQNSSEVILLNMDMSGGDADSLHKFRLQELESIANKFATKLYKVNNDKEQYLSNLINDIKPSYIYLPFYFDWHDEHIMTMRILQNVLSNSGYVMDVIMYQVSMPIIPFMCNSYLPLDKREHEYKWDIFKTYYKSQRCIPYKRFSMNERINGALVGAYAAEVFCKTSVTEWLLNINNWLLSKTEKELILKNLLSIRKTRNLLTEFYNKRTWKKSK